MSKVIDVKGTPFEQGVQQGQQLKAVILKNLEMVRALLVNNNVDRQKYDAFIKANADFLEREHSEIIEELHGIAEGSGISYEDILVLNIPAYFMKEYFSQECSMLLVRGKATKDGNTYIIKNRDMSAYLEQVVIKREYPDGMKIAEVNGAGTVTYPACGLNQYGLGITNTGFWSKKAIIDVDRVGSAQVVVNSHLILRNCRTAKEALKYLLENPRINGLNMMLADKTDAYLVELTKNDAYVEEDDGRGVLFRTNHYVSSKMSWMNPEPQQYASTFKRYDRIKELVEKQYGNLRFQDLVRIMSDHENGVNSICRHPREGAPAKTVSSSMMVLEDMEIWTTIGNPCEQLPHTAVK